ncbi:helix-turn-helix domain-containing protein [Desulfuromonas carbonis]|uniref:helix-turn-helix transcriptional regulator n=1 Tax=Desulfuromonas sp. DDH964 TaxID=1823759 RepID=UPI00078C4882|nr:helix-turn-helix transcriptional regulator [Desulfuromonas sp. DDH964]AMV72718.1 helix-turn-helix XRE domain-containing protein [Desulfuromonas sp. DDH964]
MANKILPPTVCLDSSAVRRIREEKKLTQLYVAKVVGVTTDTISRWENNRYPSIKRENALNLAVALEVEVDELLQPAIEEMAAVAEAAEETTPALIRYLPLLGVVVVLAALFGYYQRQESPGLVLIAKRVLPEFAAPGGIVPVRVRLEAGPETKGFILREHFPPGWQLIEANPPPSSLNNEEGTARWIVKPDETRPLIAYLVRAATDAPLGSTGSFSGEIVANPNGNNAPTALLGENNIKVGPYLWADLNGDGRVDDSEMLTASDTFDEMKGVHLDWNQLEDIWDAEGYRWDPGKRVFIPEHPGK